MDTTATAQKAIYSIAYFGTYASGKLLAGERMGFPCTATVPTWFTDSPTTCPIPCWYPALKPTTGAATRANVQPAYQDGYGAAIVGWNADGSLGLVSTGSLPYTIYSGCKPLSMPDFMTGNGIEVSGTPTPGRTDCSQPGGSPRLAMMPSTMMNLHSASPATTARPGTRLPSLIPPLTGSTMLQSHLTAPPSTLLQSTATSPSELQRV